MSVGVFGDIFVSTKLEAAVINTLSLWLPDYIAETERQNELEPETIQMPRSYSTVNDFYKFNEDQFPAVIVISPGLAPKPPSKKGDGSYNAWYRVGVGIISGGRDRETTRQLAAWYIAAARDAILQHQSLGDFDAEGITWTNERTTDIPDEQGRTLHSGAATFDVEVKGVGNSRMGPLTPSEDPYVDQVWPPITETEATVELMED